MNLGLVIKGFRRNSYLARVVWKKYGFAGSLKLLNDDILFDIKNRTDTVLPINERQLFNANELGTNRKYAPSTFQVVEDAIRHAESIVDIANSNFVDYGSGKGKALIAASRSPFRKIIGIEYSELLHQIADKNMAKLGLQERVDLLNIDASSYIPKPDDRVFYFFNPFSGEVLDKCLRNIADTKSKDNPRVLLYANPHNDEEFVKYFERTEELLLNPGEIRVNKYIA